MTPALMLSSASLLSKWGFNDGSAFEDVAEWFHESHSDPPMHHCNCGYFDLGVDGHELLVEVVKRYMLPALDQRVEVEEIQTSHNPVRACSIDGVPVPDDVHYGRLPEPARLTPEVIEVPYESVLAVVGELRNGA